MTRDIQERCNGIVLFQIQNSEVMKNLQKREVEFSSRLTYLWFSKYHADEVRSSMIVPIRGLVHAKKKNWDKFCDKMLMLVKIQYQELEKAVMRTGEYCFWSRFAYLESCQS